MKVLSSIGNVIVKKPSLVVFIFFVVFSFDRYNRWVNFNKDNFPLVHDVDQFYSYLPAAFIQHDLTFKFPNNYWTVTAGNGNKIARTTYGMAAMYSPFFFVGHIYAGANGYDQNGYTLPYKWSLHAGTFLYALLGIWLCRKNLLRFFSELVTALTLFAIFLGTNLFYYTFGWGEMSHSYLFFILSAAVYTFFKWKDSNKIKFFYLFSFFAGFATLIRPTDIVILLLPLLYNVSNFNDFKSRVNEFISLGKAFFLGGLIFIAPIFFQLLYWKMYSGNWYIFTYGAGEGFYFSDPQVSNFLFSYRKGWFIYTPIMMLLLIGIPLLIKQSKQIFVFVVLYFLVNVYLLSSWWDWGFGGSFGSRAIIQHYVVFALGLAAFFNAAFNWFKNIRIINYSIRFACMVLVLACVKLNYNQSWQYKYALIHPSGMTKEAYWFVFNKEKFNATELETFEHLIKLPDYPAMISGKRD